MPHYNDHDEEIKKQVVKLWGEGLSGTEISLQLKLPNFTRNSVIGIVYRENTRLIRAGLQPIAREFLNPKQTRVMGNTNKAGHFKRLANGQLRETSEWTQRSAPLKLKPPDVKPLFKTEFVDMSDNPRVRSILNVTGCRFFLPSEECCNKIRFNNTMWCKKHYHIVYEKGNKNVVNSDI